MRTSTRMITVAALSAPLLFGASAVAMAEGTQPNHVGNVSVAAGNHHGDNHRGHNRHRGHNHRGHNHRGHGHRGHGHRGHGR